MSSGRDPGAGQPARGERQPGAVRREYRRAVARLAATAGGSPLGLPSWWRDPRRHGSRRIAEGLWVIVAAHDAAVWIAAVARCSTAAARPADRARRAPPRTARSHPLDLPAHRRSAETSSRAADALPARSSTAASRISRSGSATPTRSPGPRRALLARLRSRVRPPRPGRALQRHSDHVLVDGPAVDTELFDPSADQSVPPGWRICAGRSSATSVACNATSTWRCSRGSSPARRIGLGLRRPAYVPWTRWPGFPTSHLLGAVAHDRVPDVIAASTSASRRCS